MFKDSNYNKKIFFFYTIIFLFFYSFYANAENEDYLNKVIERLNSVEKELKNMQMNDSNTNDNNINVNLNDSIANHEKRLIDIEEEIRSLNGFLEELNFKLDNINKLAESKNTDQKNEPYQQEADNISQDQTKVEQKNTVVLEDPNIQKNPTMKVLGTVNQSESTNEQFAEDNVNQQQAVILPEEVTEQQAVSNEQLALLSKSPSEIYKYAYDMLIRENFSEAEKSFKAFIGEHPDNPLASNAYYWLGETYYVQKKFQLAAISFARGFQNFPKGNKATDQLFKLALTFMNLGKNEDACAAFSKLESEFPNTPKRISNRAKEYMKRAKC